MICGRAATVWLRSPPPSCIRMMLPLPASASCEHALHDGVGGRRSSAVGFAPIVRIDARADDDVAHRLRDRQHLNFAGGFRLMVDAVRRTEERGFHAEIAFEQQLGEVQFESATAILKSVSKIGMSEGVIADLVSQIDIRVSTISASWLADSPITKNAAGAFLSFKMSRIFGVQFGSGPSSKVSASFVSARRPSARCARKAGRSGSSRRR